MNDIFAKNVEWLHFNSSVLLEVTRPTGVFNCSAVAISPEVLLTAAHCLEGVITAVHALTFPENQKIDVHRFEIHPNYNDKKSHYLNDIAKISLTKPLPKSIEIHKVYKKSKVKGQLVRLGFGERNSLNNRSVITPTLKFLDKPNKLIELNDQYSKSGDSGGPIFIVENKVISLLAIHSTFSSGPEGEFSYNPLVAEYLDWINIKI